MNYIPSNPCKPVFSIAIVTSGEDQQQASLLAELCSQWRANDSYTECFSH